MVFLRSGIFTVYIYTVYSNLYFFLRRILPFAIYLKKVSETAFILYGWYKFEVTEYFLKVHNISRGFPIWRMACKIGILR